MSDDSLYWNPDFATQQEIEDYAARVPGDVFVSRDEVRVFVNPNQEDRNGRVFDALMSLVRDYMTNCEPNLALVLQVIEENID